MHVLQSKASDGIIDVIIGDRILTNDNGFTFIKLVVENSSIRYWAMRVYGSKSVGILTMENTAISGLVYSKVKGGLASMDFNNCTFHLSPWGRVVEAESVLQVKIINCKFSLALYGDKCDSPRGCIVNVKGLRLYYKQQSTGQLIFSQL